MELFETKNKTKCDFLTCNNISKYSFRIKKIFNTELNLCESCAKELYNEMGKIQIPRSLETPFKNKIKIK
ncbi:MAG: hypothetical protein RR247_00075 [Clostridia bacterium]